MQWKKLALGMLAMVLCLSGCGTKETVLEPEKEASVVGDLIYGQRSKNEVLIQENGQDVPFLVFDYPTADSVLLLRKNPLFPAIPFNSSNATTNCWNYYPESNIDDFLINVYLNQLSEPLKEVISPSAIAVASKDSILSKSESSEPEYILRDVFLLSASEWGIQSNMIIQEGFEIDGITDFPAEKQEWLRTSYLWDEMNAWSMSSTKYGQVKVTESLPVRPAFCIPENTPVKEEGSEDTISLAIP